MSSSVFDELEPGVPAPSTPIDTIPRATSPSAPAPGADDGGDLKTLRLSSLPFTPELLDGFIALQADWIERLQAARDEGEEAWRSAIAAGWTDALSRSPLALAEISRLEPVVRDLCGRLWTRRRLEGARTTFRSLMADGRLDAEARERLEELEKTLAGDVAEPVVRRWGPEAVEVLRPRQAELLSLHERLLPLLRGPA